MNKSVLAVGDVNTDIVMAGLAHMPLSEQDVLAERMELLVGGQISTFARASARLGLQVQVVARVGDDYFGEQARSRLAADGVDTSTMVVDPDHATGATVVLSSGRERAFATYAGALNHLRREDVPRALLARHAHMHLGSFYYHKDLRPKMGDIFLEAKSMGLSTSMDPGWDPEHRWDADILDVLPHVDVFIPNKVEAMRISQQASPRAAVEWLGRYSQTVVAKMGAEGCLLFHQGDCPPATAEKENHA